MSSDLDLNFSGAKRGNQPAREPNADLLVRTTLAFKIASIHQLGNRAVTQPVQTLVEGLNYRFREQGATQLRVQSVRDSFFVSRELVNLDYGSNEVVATLRPILRRLGVHEIAFLDPLSEVEMRACLQSFQDRYWGKVKGVGPCQLHPKVELRVISKAQRDALFRQGDRREELVRAYAGLAVAMRSAAMAVKAGRPPPAGDLRRATQLVAEAAEGQEPLLVALTRYANPGREPYWHPIAVGALVLLMLKRSGASRKLLTELPVQAMLHDIARLEVSDPFQVDGIPDDAAIAAAVANRARIGIRSLLEIASGEISVDVLGRATLAYEVTLPHAGPKRVLAPMLIAKIVEVACAYQHLTSPMPPRRGLTPDRALRFILENAGTRWDPRAARLLAATVGLYPIGTLVRLRGGWIAVVSGLPSDPNFPTYPPVRVVSDGENAMDQWLDLAKEGPELEIESTLDPLEEGLHIPNLFTAGTPPPDTGLSAHARTEARRAAATAHASDPPPLLHV